MDHIDEDLALKNFSENSIITVESNITKHSSNESCSLAKDSNQNLQAFMGKFKKSPMKFSPVVEKLIDAPFPKVSHVQQIDVEFMKRWNLPVVKHRFWREEFFLWTDHFYGTVFINLNVVNGNERTKMR